MKPIKIGSLKLRPGEKKTIAFPVREGRKRVTLPLTVIHGSRPGKRMVILANKHGNEMNSIESVRRFCAEMNPKSLNGTILAVASANPKASLAVSPCWGEGDDGKEAADYQSQYNMNWIWPGKTGGLWVERAVHEMWNQLVFVEKQPADFVVDMHCHSSRSATYAENESQILLGIMSGVTAVINRRTEEAFALGLAKPSPICGLNEYCTRHNIPCATIELNGQNAMNREGIEDGVRALWNWAALFGLCHRKFDLPEKIDLVDPWRSAHHPSKQKPPSYMEFKARNAGILIPHKKSYELVRKGEILYEILNPYQAKIVETSLAPMRGIIYVAPNQAVCKTGDHLFTIASNRKVKPLPYFKKHVGKTRSKQNSLPNFH